MKPFVIKPVSVLQGEVSLLGDKSIAHRAVILSALSKGATAIKNFPFNKDCLCTISAFKKLGVKINHASLRKTNCITVFGRGLRGLKKAKAPIFIEESGTTFRLLLGVLAGQEFNTKLIAGGSLSQRPMRRVTEPLRQMGAKINSKSRIKNSEEEEYPPIRIMGSSLNPIAFRMPVASAQVKSAILLAGLYAKGKTTVVEPTKTRDHTERMLQLFRADIKLQQNKIVINGNKELVSPRCLTLPGDISSASFFIVLAGILPKAKLLIRNVSLNSTRTGVLDVLKRMGADIKVIKYPGHQATLGEPRGDLLVKNSSLRGTKVTAQEIPSLIDELPILMVASSFAKGKTIFEGIGELRVKETDRIKSMTTNLKGMGVNITVSKTKGAEKIIIQGVNKLEGAKMRSFGDHRTAMSMIIAGLAAEGKAKLDDISCIDKSFPDFLSFLSTLTH